MPEIKPRRGRPKGSGIDDRSRLRQLASLLRDKPDLKPTTAIRALGIKDPSAIRRLRDKFHLCRSELMIEIGQPAPIGTVGHGGRRAPRPGCRSGAGATRARRRAGGAREDACARAACRAEGTRTRGHARRRDPAPAPCARAGAGGAAGARARPRGRGMDDGLVRLGAAGDDVGGRGSGRVHAAGRASSAADGSAAASSGAQRTGLRALRVRCARRGGALTRPRRDTAHRASHCDLRAAHPRRPFFIVDAEIKACAARPSRRGGRVPCAG